MQDYTLNYTYKINLNKALKKKLDVNSEKDINAIYYYDKDTILINLRSNEFVELSEDEFINNLSKNILHELLHRCIYQITNKVADIYEERIIDLILE